MLDATPTGQIRYRTHTRSFRHDLLVLQVEVRWRGPLGLGISPRMGDCTGWRDARAQDLSHPNLRWIHGKD